MSQRAPVTALLDLSVYNRTATIQPAVKEQRVWWAGKSFTVQVHGITRRPLPGVKEAWLREQIEALPTVTRLTREGEIRLFSYSELKLEALGGAPGLRGIVGDLLRDVTVEHVPAAIGRSRFQQSIDFREHAGKEKLIQYCEMLLSPNFDAATVSQLPLGLTDFDLRNLCSLQRFREICRALDRTQYPDAFHLWTAETNALDYFLTIDKKFINVMTHTSQAQGRTRAVSPVGLLQDLGIIDLDPLPVGEGFHEFK